MTFLAAAALLVGSGWALLAALGLCTGRRLIDAPMAWFAGTGWLALASLLLRFGAGLPWGRTTALLVLALPAGGLAARRLLRRRTGQGSTPGPAPSAQAARWWPRRRWLVLPMAAYVLVVAAGTVLHGIDTPTHTDDGLRVRAYVPVLALRDDWSPPARDLLAMAGAVPTFVPALPGALFGAWNPFHPNYFVVACFVAFLWLVVALASARGAPERGWAGAFAVLTLPLLVYHATSTYADAVLAFYLAAAFLFHLEYGRDGHGSDAARAAVLLAAAALVKREGLPLAGLALAGLLSQGAWRAREAGTGALRRMALAATPLLLVLLGAGWAIGFARSVPFLDLLAARLTAQPAATSATALAVAPAPLELVLRAYGHALFRSGDAGMLFWVLPVVVALALPRLRATGLGGPLFTVVGLFAAATASALWLIPQYTLDGTTVNRSLLAVELLGALFAVAALYEATPAAELAKAQRPAAPDPGPRPRRARRR